ncbi:MAG: DUF4168 domain-containing protein [Crocosphaera sp.]
MFKQLLWKGCLSIVISAGCLAGLPAYSQPGEAIASDPTYTVASNDISSQELEQFAKAVATLRKIDEATQTKMMEAVQAAGMTPEEFMEISKNKENIDEIPADKQLQFQKALDQVRKLYEEDRQQKRQAVKDEGLEISRFNEIGKMVQSDRSLQKKVVEILSGQEG